MLDQSTYEGVKKLPSMCMFLTNKQQSSTVRGRFGARRVGDSTSDAQYRYNRTTNTGC